MIKIILLLTVMLVHGCTQSNDSTPTTELEGAWSSICVSIFSTPEASHTIVTTYKGNMVNTQVNNYTDSNCTQLESTVDISQSSLPINPDSIQVSFNIGNQVTSANGVTVKEIDFVTVTNEKQLNIFLLQDNDNTLYFGVPCKISPSSCVNNRPTEIDYAGSYSKIN